MSRPPLREEREYAATCSDTGNAQLLADWSAHELRWISAWKQWYTWNVERGLWVLEEGAVNLVSQTAVTMYHDAVERLREAQVAHDALFLSNDKAAIRAAKERCHAAKSLVGWYTRSQNAERCRATLTLASSMPEFRTEHETLDAKPELFMTPSGTVDLWSGKLRPWRREDFLTKSSPVPYDPAATCPAWDAFLTQVTCGDAELAAYLQRIAGYCLTGSTDEHFLGFFYGEGANGKSTFLTILADITGDYFTQAPRGLLFWASHDRHPTELATLFQKRLAICSEVEEGARLDEAKVKDLTGGDRITARRMREDFWTFLPTHKLLIAGNQWFFVRGRDHGIWRRIHVVPWRLNLPPESVDTEILAKLRKELPGILAWAVRGAVEWRRNGLAEPTSCANIRDQFRTNTDLFEQFWEESVVLDPEGRVAYEVLYDTFLDWAASHKHAEVLTPRRFAKRVREKGVRSGAVRSGGDVCKGWYGARLATAEERAARRWGMGE